MISRIYVDNYKCLVNFELRLDPLSLLVGKNGVGKSAILDVLFALRHLLDGTAKISDAGMFRGSSVTRWQSGSTQVFEVDVDLDGDAFNYRLEIEHDENLRRARISHEGLTLAGLPLFAFNKGEVQLYRDDHGPGPVYTANWSESALARVAPRSDNTKLTRFMGFVQRIIVCGLYPRGFSPESTEESPRLSRSGDNFASWYRHAMQEHQDLMLDYVQALREVIDDFDSLRLERVGVEARALMVRFRGQTEKYELRLDELSDGQRALLAIYALVHLTSGQGYTLFLDEPDNYVALPELQPWLMALSDACGDTLPQAVICSHHPELIDYLGPESGLLLQREVSGVTKVRALAELDIGDALTLSEVIARGWGK